MYKLLKPLSISSIVWALIVSAVVLLIATSANAQTSEGNAPQSTEIVPPTAPTPNTPATSTPSRTTLPPIPQPRTTDQQAAPASVPPPTDTASSTVTPASSPAVPTQRSDMLAERLADLNERRAAIESKRLTLQNSSTTRRALLPEATQQKALNGMARVESVLGTAISKSRDFVERLRSRAMALEARGLDVSSPLSYIDQAVAQLDLAEEALRDIDINAEYAITSAEPRTDWQDVRAQFSVVRTALKEAHESLRAGTTGIRSLLIGNTSTETEDALTPNEQ